MGIVNNINMGISSDPIPNSPHCRHQNYIADSKENYYMLQCGNLHSKII